MPIPDVRRARIRATTRTIVAALAAVIAVLAPMATNGYSPRADAKPPVLDGAGFVNSPARCDGGRSPVLAGRTALSLVVICRDSRGRYEYRGVRLRDGAPLELPATALGNGCFGASTKDITYTVSKRKLLLTAGLRVVRDEAMLEFRDFATSEEAPITKAAGQVGG